MSNGMEELMVDTDLVFATAFQQGQHWQQFIHHATGPVALNLSQVKRSDSAGLALMIEAVRLGRTLKKPVFFKAIPEQMMAMMRFCNILSLFEEEKWIN